MHAEAGREAMQVAALHAEAPGGLGPVVVALGHGGLNQLSRERVDGVTQRLRRPAHGGRGGRVEPEVMALDDDRVVVPAFGSADGGAQDRVLELADVAGPVVVAQALACVGAQAQLADSEPVLCARRGSDR